MRLIASLLVTGLLLATGSPALAGVRLEGVSGELRDNVLAHLRLDDEACDADPVKIRHRFAQAVPTILRALRPFGYYQVTVQPELRQPQEGCWEAVFRIDPGEPVLVGDVRVEVLGDGRDLEVFRSIVADAGLTAGKPLRHADYEAIRNRLLIAVREYGFFDAELEASVLEVDVDAGRADMTLIMNTYDRYRFGELSIVGAVLDERLIRRYVEFAPDAPFEQRRIRSLHDDLIRGDFFSAVDVRVEQQEDRTADVILTLEEGRRIRYGVGVGFGTDTGLLVRGDLVNRRMNRRGHRLELDTELSRARQNVTLDYRMPGRRPQSDWHSIYGGINRQDTEAVESIAWKTGYRQNRFHSIRWSSTPFVEFVAEQFEQDGDWNTKLSLVPGWGLNFITADAPSRPTRGLRLKAEVAGASNEVISDTSFLRLHGVAKLIMPISRRGRLLLRGEAGWMTADDFEKVPPTWRFFAGGDRSVRGYDYQSLGPLDDEGKATGGSRVLTGSIEGDWRFRERWSGALFADAGNVGKESLLDPVPWAVGAGVRWYSPVGPIRVDLAFPQQGDGSFRIHVSMGPDL